MNIHKITQNQLKTCTKWQRSGNSDKGAGLTHGLCWWWSWRIRRRRSLGLNSLWPTYVSVKAIDSPGDANQRTYESRYLHYNAKHHRCRPLHWWWLGICTYHASRSQHHVTTSQFDLKSVLALLLRTESFTICPAPQEKEKNITIRLSKQKLLKINSRIKLSKKNSYGKSIQLIKNRTTLRWRWSLWDKVLCRKVAAKRVEDGVDNQSVQSGPCETNLPAC